MTSEPRLVELGIDALAAGGDGVGRGPDGRVVFVPFAAPGDRLRVRIVEDHPRFARGEIDAILAPGPDRVAAPCEVFGRCGGCAWQHLAYGAEVAAKRAILRDALARGAGLRELPPADQIDFVASPAPYGYRGRARVLASPEGVGFRQRRSHALCAVRGCPVLAPPLDAALGALAASPPAEAAEWELALGSGGEVRSAPLEGPGARAGAPVVLEAAGERIAVSPGVFAQANVPLLGALAEAVIEAARPRHEAEREQAPGKAGTRSGRGGVVLELFAGAGFFTLGLARRFDAVAAVESDPAALRDLAGNLAAAGLRHVRVIEARVEDWLATGAAEALGPDVVVLDPPRGGIGPDPARRLARLRPRRIVHLSCDPATLARDVRALLGRGYGLVSVCGFDLFPQTPHVEALAVLERAG